MDSVIKSIYRYVTLRLLFPWQYRKGSRRLLQQKKAVFIEPQLPGLSDSMRVLYDRLQREDGWQLRVHCLREASVGKAAFVRLALACLDDMADAAYIFLCDASRVVSCIRPRQETVITQLWHGCGAFKKFGMSTAQSRFGGTRADYERYPWYRNLDYVTISSPQVAWAYEEAMCLEKDSGQVQATGVSRTDIFFQEAFREAARERVRALVPETAGKTVLLYAPTFRGNVSGAQAPDALDLAAMARALDGYCLLIKHHPAAKNRPFIPEEAKGFAFDVTEETDIADLLVVSDICISDYSSLIFEYALFERPMLFFAYDLEDYRDWRGFYYSYEEMTPGPVARTTQELIACIRNLERGFDPAQVRMFREKFMSACDGHATDRILSMVLTAGERKRGGKGQ